MSAIAWDLESLESRAPRPCLRLVDQADGCGARPLSRMPAAVYRRRRVVAVAVVVVATVAMGMAVASATGALVGEIPPPAGAAEPVRLVVGPGDTVWDLAAPHAPAGTDAMAYVAEVAAFNDVDPRAVRPGTVLRLPVAAN